MKFIKASFILVMTLAGCSLFSGPDATTCPSSAGPPTGPLLEVEFVETLRIRCSHGQLSSQTGADLKGLSVTLTRLGVVDVQPMFDISQAQLDRLNSDARARGEQPIDLLSWHLASLPPDADTAAVIAALLARPEVQYAYPHSTVVPPPPNSDNLDGQWAAPYSVPGSSLVFSLSQEADSLHGGGSFAIEAGRQGTLEVLGSYRRPTVNLTLIYDFGQRLFFEGHVQDSRMVGTLTDSAGRTSAGAFIRH